MAPDPPQKHYLGIRAGDLGGKWYGKYYNPDMVPLPDHATYALTLGPQAAALCPNLEELRDLAKPGYQPLETGYALNPDGSMFIAGLTRFPRASPAMLDWWFWWFSRDPTRYKLWHPRGHLHVGIEARESPAGTSDRERYIGTVIHIEEYVGSSPARLRIHWLDPAELGFDQVDLDPEHATAACCRVGLSEAPLEWGYLIHHVRRVEDGAEMRVRLWMGGKHVAPRDNATSLTEETRQQLEGMRHMSSGNAHAMLVHCCQEMTHLASFLPEIHRECQSRGEAP